MKLTSFLDYKDKALDMQIELAKQFNISYILLRYIKDKTINELTNDEIIKINGVLRREKVTIAAIDPLIMSYDLYDIEEYNNNFKMYEDAIHKAKALKTNNVFFRLPKITDILNEFDTLENQLTPIIEIANKNNVNLLIEQGESKTNIITYIMKYYKGKRLDVIFDPKNISSNKESLTASYRLLKNYSTFLIANDIDKKNNPALLGYGKLKIVDLFKRYNRDKYNDFIILDDSFKDFLKPKDEPKKGFFKRMFSKKDKEVDQYLNQYASKIYPEEADKKITLEDIYLNQIQVLNIIFSPRR